MGGIFFSMVDYLQSNLSIYGPGPFDIFAMQKRYIADVIRYDINPSYSAGHIERIAPIDGEANIENPMGIYID
jgi:hypothetical protein